MQSRRGGSPRPSLIDVNASSIDMSQRRARTPKSKLMALPDDEEPNPLGRELALFLTSEMLVRGRAADTRNRQTNRRERFFHPSRCKIRAPERATGQAAQPRVNRPLCCSSPAVKADMARAVVSGRAAPLAQTPRIRAAPGRRERLCQAA